MLCGIGEKGKMPKYIVDLLDTKNFPSRVVKSEIVVAGTSNKAIDKFIHSIYKKYDLAEMRDNKYARYVVMSNKAIQDNKNWSSEFRKMVKK
jgi:hypothetical protein